MTSTSTTVRSSAQTGIGGEGGGESLEVNVEEIRSHAKTVDDIGARVGQAADAAAHVASLDDAYGIFCQPFGAALREPQQRGVEAIQSSFTAIQSTSDKLQRCGDAYEKADEAFSAALQEILDQVDAMMARQGGGR
ncbi:MAG: ESX-1 secretion-associated protein [Rhodococcus sp.]|nr:ESX-1 secretion-associated protein [Rhodococcus sp. (in: high G+C Gram-positive bacteria)]